MDMAEDNQFLGRGWSFPPVFNKITREVEMLDGEADVQSSIEIILTTQLEERVLRPNFGWRRDQWLFESMTTTMITMVQKEIENALLFFEPRINLNTVRLLPTDRNNGKIEVLVDYIIKSTNTRGNLVFPFYLTEI